VTGCFTALNWLFDHWLSKNTALFFAYPPTVLLHYTLHKWWTFGSRSETAPRQIGEYLVMVVVAFVIQWGVFQLLSRWTAWPGWVEAGLASLAQMSLTFAVMQRRIFGARPLTSNPLP
jgi:putative flippase GtrA